MHRFPQRRLPFISKNVAPHWLELLNALNESQQRHFLYRYSGKIPRNQAERLVEQSNLPPGTFLVREREGDNGGLLHL